MMAASQNGWNAKVRLQPQQSNVAINGKFAHRIFAIAGAQVMNGC